MIPLETLPTGSKAKIVEIRGGPNFIQRLYQMGLTPGTTVEVVMNSRGPVVIRVRGVTVALGRGMAARVFVETLTQK
jgi:ferrous iron transport protein A